MTLRAFEGFGIEIEYAIVDRDSFDVRPVADRLLEEAAGAPASELERGRIAWSNELSLHVIELKTNGPAPCLDGVADDFAAELRYIDELLAPRGARVLPCAMHPWMDPGREQRLWPHEQTEIYHAYDRIFGCRGHGWANLQSTHLNLPFADDEEFVRLHTAIRTLLPLLPAVAAASPFVDGRVSGLLDTRLEVYRGNQARVPEIAGRVVPDYVASIDEYHARILEPMYRAIAPYDADGVLHGEWLNSRGAIARFDRDAIEIRVLDAQESPRADLDVVRAVTALVRALYEERASSLAAQAALPTSRLADLFEQTLRLADAAPVEDAAYLAALGVAGPPRSAGEVWQELLARHAAGCRWRAPLARRLLADSGAVPDHARLLRTCRRLGACLDSNGYFPPRDEP
ncbi:MAG: glutamate--cysteine ligase [Gammaproteobacteria bacterium]|nr:glutamate--cysteine ligase [Gammaproteobacteria bacterium]MCP5199850.1 glutamate--cysteine ligase [Gammaproteobacteria bacterium]